MMMTREYSFSLCIHCQCGACLLPVNMPNGGAYARCSRDMEVPQSIVTKFIIEFTTVPFAVPPSSSAALPYPAPRNNINHFERVWNSSTIRHRPPTTAFIPTRKFFREYFLRSLRTLRHWCRYDVYNFDPLLIIVIRHYPGIKISIRKASLFLKWAWDSVFETKAEIGSVDLFWIR